MMKMDILDEMTKEELIWWIRKEIFLKRPRKSDILFYRWEKKSKKISDRRDAHIAYGKSINMAKRDEYARQFNASTDIKERLPLVEKMEPYIKKFQKWLDDGKAIRKVERSLDKLYDRIDIEREKEVSERR